MNDFKIDKIIEINDEKYCLIRSQIDKLENTELDSKADYAATEDFNFFAGFKREPRFRQGLIAKIIDESFLNNISNSETTDCNIVYEADVLADEKIKIISEKNINIIDAHKIKDFVIATFIDGDNNKIKLAAFIPNKNSIKEIETIKGYEIRKISSDNQNKALLLIENDKEQVLISYDFIDSYKAYNSQTICKKASNISRIMDIGFESSQVYYKLREGYRTVEVGIKTAKKDNPNLFVNKEKGYSVLYPSVRSLKLEMTNRTARSIKVTEDEATPSVISTGESERFGMEKSMASHLHIHINSFDSDNFDSFDFLIKYGINILKIERNFSKVYLKKDLEIETKKVFNSIKSYFEEEKEEYASISISGLGFGASVALNIVNELDKIELIQNARINALVLENFAGDNLTYKYTSYNGSKIANMDYQGFWAASPLQNSPNIDIPCLIMSHKNNYDFWYGGALSFYGAMKFLEKKSKFILFENSNSHASIEKRKDEIAKWIK